MQVEFLHDYILLEESEEAACHEDFCGNPVLLD